MSHTDLQIHIYSQDITQSICSMAEGNLQLLKHILGFVWFRVIQLGARAVMHHLLFFPQVTVITTPLQPHPGVNMTNDKITPVTCTMYSLHITELLQTLGIKITNLTDIIHLNNIVFCNILKVCHFVCCFGIAVLGYYC